MFGERARASEGYCLSELISFSENVIYELSRMWTHRCTPGVLVHYITVGCYISNVVVIY